MERDSAGRGDDADGPDGSGPGRPAGLGDGGAFQDQGLPLPLSLLLAGMMGGGSQMIAIPGPRGDGGAGSGSLVLLTMPGRGLMPGRPDVAGPFGFMQGLGMMSAPGGESRGPGDEPGLPEGLGEAMQAMMDHMARVVLERSMEENSARIPPAKETVRDALPRVVVTKEDLIDSTNSRCSVCLEDYRPGSRATRMLCGHLFCTACIREWLRGANSCPVCRYELATDEVDFEHGRKQRMDGRVVKLRAGDLRMLRVPELRRLMRALEVSGEGCVEKADMVKELAAAPGVEVSPEESECALDKRHRYEARELEMLELSLLLNLIERHRVPLSRERDDLTEEEERQAALKSLTESGWMLAPTPRSKRQSEAQSERRSKSPERSAGSSVSPTLAEEKEKEKEKESSEGAAAESIPEPREVATAAAKSSPARRPSQPKPAVMRPRPSRPLSSAAGQSASSTGPAVSSGSAGSADAPLVGGPPMSSGSVSSADALPAAGPPVSSASQPAISAGPPVSSGLVGSAEAPPAAGPPVSSAPADSAEAPSAENS